MDTTYIYIYIYLYMWMGVQQFLVEKKIFVIWILSVAWAAFFLEIDTLH